MARKKNSPFDVFKYIDMQGGDEDKCWLWTGSLGGTDKRPYFAIDGVRRLAYRIVYELFKGVTLTRAEHILHQCDTPACCNPRHMKAGSKESSHQENMDEMKERERHGLPHDTVRAIKRLLQEGVISQVDIAEHFGISRQSVTAINTGETYSHVTLNEGET